MLCLEKANLSHSDAVTAMTAANMTGHSVPADCRGIRKCNLKWSFQMMSLR